MHASTSSGRQFEMTIQTKCHFDMRSAATIEKSHLKLSGLPIVSE